MIFIRRVLARALWRARFLGFSLWLVIRILCRVGFGFFAAGDVVLGLQGLLLGRSSRLRSSSFRFRGRGLGFRGSFRGSGLGGRSFRFRSSL